MPHRCWFNSAYVLSGPTPLGHAAPTHPPEHVAAVPLLESVAHVALFAGSMYQFGIVHDGGMIGDCVPAIIGRLIAGQVHEPFAPEHAASASCAGVRVSGAGGGGDHAAPADHRLRGGAGGDRRGGAGRGAGRPSARHR